MNKEIKDKWVAALRSGEYKQTKGKLRDDSGFCCLGVLCDLVRKEGMEAPSVEGWQTDWEDFFKAADKEEVLPDGVREWAGMRTDIGDLTKPSKLYSGKTNLARLNDNGVDFPTIADIIDEQWETL